MFRLCARLGVRIANWANLDIACDSRATKKSALDVETADRDHGVAPRCRIGASAPDNVGILPLVSDLSTSQPRRQPRRADQVSSDLSCFAHLQSTPRLRYLM